MEAIGKIVLYIHIVSGIVALLSGLVAMVTRKGGLSHKRAGRVFFVVMLSVSATAIALSIMNPNIFLLTIGIFSFYLNYNGWRAIRNKSLKPDTADWVILVLALLNALYMVYLLNPVLMIFGGISLFLSAGQLADYFRLARGKGLQKKQWLARHIGMMTGAYIATLTAFLVVNVQNFNPGWLPWIAPTAVLTPFITYWTRKYTKTGTR